MKGILIKMRMARTDHNKTFFQDLFVKKIRHKETMTIAQITAIK